MADLLELDEAPSETVTIPDVGGVPFVSTLTIEGEETTDHRLFQPGAFIWRDLPLPLMWLREDSHGGMPGHSYCVGRIDTIERVDNEITATGVLFDDPNVVEYGPAAIALVRSGGVRGVSIDYEPLEYTIEFPPMPDLDDDVEDTITEADSAREVHTSTRIMGATIVAFPAFPGADITLPDQTVEEESPVVASLVSARARDLLAKLAAPAVPAASGAAIGDEPTIDDAPVDVPEVDADQPAEAPHTSTVLVAVPSEPSSIVVDGGLPADELHITLGFYGDDVSDDDVDALRAFVDEHAVDGFQARVGGVARMGDDDPQAVVLLVEADELQMLRDALPVTPDTSKHPHFTPHLTLGYGIDAPADVPATIDVTGVELWHGDEHYTGVSQPDEEDAIVAAAAPVAPPSAWFEKPGLSGPTPLTVTDEGRVFGHVAAWGVCHIGMPGCEEAPRSASDYAFFRTGEVVTKEGARVSVGQITMGPSHASINDTPRAAAAHYENVATAVADVAAGEDEYGIWVAGSVRPHLSARDVHALRAASPSGDWRWINGGHEMIALSTVNVPGFPVPRAKVASGVVTALVASYSCMEQSRAGHPSSPGSKSIREHIARSVGRDRRSRRLALVASVHTKES